jgi:hypothetical protein
MRLISWIGDRMLAAVAPRAVARACNGSTHRECCNGSCTVTKVCWGCGMWCNEKCCSACVHD